MNKFHDFTIRHSIHKTLRAWKIQNDAVSSIPSSSASDAHPVEEPFNANDGRGSMQKRLQIVFKD